MINVFEKYIEITEQPDPLTGEVNVEELEFSFSPEWEGLNKIAVFTTLGVTKYQAIENGRCYIPESVLAGDTELGVFGFEMDGKWLKKRLSPRPVTIKFGKGSYIRGGDSESIPPTDFERYVAEIEELIGDIKEVDSIDIVNNHLIVTYTNGETHDAGVIDVPVYSYEVEVEFNQSGNIFLQQSDIDYLYANQPQTLIVNLTQGGTLAARQIYTLIGKNDVVGIKNGLLNYVLINDIDEIENKFNFIQIPTSSTSKLIIREVIYQEKLTFDSTPTAQSANPVTSAGIKAYVDTAVGDIEDVLGELISGGGVE